jgi:hypothetical protein
VIHHVVRSLPYGAVVVDEFQRPIDELVHAAGSGG